MKLDYIDDGNLFNWGKTSNDYAKYRDIYPAEFYERIADFGLCIKGQKVLDLGTGTGVLPRNMYHYGAKFTAVDISENQIVEAKRLSSEREMDIDYFVSSAEDIFFPQNSFDVVTACQCHIYFDNNIVLPKIHNILRDNGHFCILWMAWLPHEDMIAKKSEDLVLKYNPSWSGAGAIRPDYNGSSFSSTAKYTKSLFDAEYEVLYDVNIPFTRDSWNGRIKACRGIGASLADEEIKAFEVEHMSMLSNLPDEFDILHYVMIIILRKREI